MASNTTELAIHRFCCLPTSSYEKMFADANTILDEIISQCHMLRAANQRIDNRKITSFISHGCEILKSATVLLRSKFAQVITIYVPHLKSCIDKTCLNNLMSFLCQSVRTSKSSLVCEFIKALSTILVGRGVHLDEDSFVELLGEDGIVWLYISQSDDLVKGYSIQCLGNMCLRSSDGELIDKQYICLCYAKLLETLKGLMAVKSNDIDHLNILIIALKALQNILAGVTVNDNIVEAEYAVSLLKIFLLYGTPGYTNIVEKLIKGLPAKSSEDLEAIEKIYPTRKKEKLVMTKKVTLKKSRKKKKKDGCVDPEERDVNDLNTDFFSRQSIVIAPSSSESDYSDSETAQKDFLNSVLLKVRQNSASILQSILRCCSRRSKFSCWLLLVPDVLSSSEPSLLYSLATEQSTKIKPTILLALMELIDGSKGFLDSTVNTIRLPSMGAFTAYSVKLSQSLRMLHETLLTALTQDQTDSGKEKVLKCLALLMLNTPYKKLSEQYLPYIFKSIHKLLHASDVFLCQATITCLAVCISVNPTNAQVLDLLQRSSTTTESSSWLVQFCIKVLREASKGSIHRLRITSDCIQLLTVLLRCHKQLLDGASRSTIIDLCSNNFLFSNDPATGLYAIKILEEFSKFYSEHFSMEEKQTEQKEAIKYWHAMITGPIPQYLQSQEAKPPKTRSAICDWLSSMGSSIFKMMKNPDQIFMKTVLIGLADDEATVLAAAAIRALGVIIDYESMKEDVWFVVDVTGILLRKIEHVSASVRIKAAWSLANLCDFLAKNQFLLDEYPENLTQKLLTYSTRAALDNEKISCNGVRALGNILKALPKHLFDSLEFQGDVSAAVQALLKNIISGSMKARWNSCYACRYMLDNHDFPVGTAQWTGDMYTTLLDAMCNCKNFKVRISAACALTSPQLRARYAGYFACAWKSALLALERTEELTDFTEFKHKDTLQTHTVTLLFHLLSLATREDLVSLTYGPHRGIFTEHAQRYLSSTEKNQEDFGNDDEEKTEEKRTCVGKMRRNLTSLFEVHPALTTLEVLETVLM